MIAAERINLFLSLRSFPVGIFSLFLSILPIKNPLGTPILHEIPLFSSAIMISLGLFLVGLALGGLYFSSVRQAALFDEVKWRVVFQEWPRIGFQSFLLSIFWFFLFIAYKGR